MKRRYAHCLVTLILTAGLLPAASAALVAHWKFDETGGPTAFDSAVGGLHGALAGGASFVGGGISGNAVSLNEATGDLVNMGNVLGAALTVSDFTISLWIKTTTTDVDTLVLSKHSAGFVNGYIVALNTSSGYGQANKPWFYTHDAPGQEAVATTSVNDDAWHHIVAVFVAGGQKSVYVDGLPVEASAAGHVIAANTADFLIGGAAVGGVPTATYTGLVDDVQIYDAVLGDNAIQSLFSNPGTPVPLPVPVWLLGSCLLGLLGAARRR